ncbi:MAG: EAL domain-containing protein [Gammaproteobacteria bacterium]|nr:EAL domain-containing protein [Gammaproteobacteria bacterium]
MVKRIIWHVMAVLAALEDNYAIQDNNYYTTCSIGATLFGLQTTTSGELMKQADIALSQAKAACRNQVSFFDPELESAISERAQLLADLREAIHKQQFQLYLQAQQDISGLITGAEALVRWQHPERGLVSPLDFIPLAEASGLMLPIGREIMRMGLALLKDWQQRDQFRELKLSLNLAAQQFYEEDFATVLINEIDTHQLDATKLMLEFTESTLLDNFSQARLNMQQLSERGVKFAIDDFGTGYSSLAYLSELPVDQLKIDQSFVRNMATRPKDKAIVRTIIDMAYSLGMEVIAEGVETEEQRNYLLSQGCMLYQGYLIGRPEVISAFDERIVRQLQTM